MNKFKLNDTVYYFKWPTTSIDTYRAIRVNEHVIHNKKLLEYFNSSDLYFDNEITAIDTLIEYLFEMRKKILIYERMTK